MQMIRNDPAWKNGEYTTEPVEGLRGANDLIIIAGSAPLQMQKNYPTRAQAEAYVDRSFDSFISHTDANNFLYYVNASRNYNPEPKLSMISAPVLWINSADDFINPPELDIAEQAVKQIKHGRFVLLPIGPNTHGHGTHTFAVAWKPYLAELLREAEKAAPR
jgi:homoserine O-acetyltransferase